jgi:peptidoglycan/LPS O-acetylase OafA/YrhL
MVVVCHSLNDLPGMTRTQNMFVRLSSQGWAGVDLFFVLSGFLITGILMDARDSAHPLRNFYARRVLRIVPVYVVFLCFSLWFATAIGTSSVDDAARLHATQLWYWCYSQNILIALHNWSASTFPTAHLWSLAVEEQFYLLWPLVVLLISPIALRRTTLGCIVAAEVCRIAFILSGADGQVNYVLLPTRMDTLAAGAFLACAYREPALWGRVLRARQGMTLLALVMLLCTVMVRHTIDNQASLEQVIVFPALVVLGVVIVASAAAGSPWMANGVLRFIAKISYGMYVWHLVVRQLLLTWVNVPASTSPSAWWIFYGLLAGGTIIGTVLVSLISWHAIEQPFLKLKRFVPNS